MLEYDTDFSEIILELYHKWKANEKLIIPEHLDKFTRKSQAKDLANLLDLI
jgi:hypothetical protein